MPDTSDELLDRARKLLTRERDQARAERDAAMADALTLRSEAERTRSLLADILRQSERRDLEDAGVRVRIRECLPPPPSPDDDIPF